MSNRCRKGCRCGQPQRCQLECDCTVVNKEERCNCNCGGSRCNPCLLLALFLLL
ncbi:MAG: hypothetical protein GXX99_08375 [Clostridiales bacterium]|nr:hypothetical protein [Clostridiales bacterium]